MNISFVMPAYNAEKTIKESLDSILIDNFEVGDEIIIINDCSSDNTREIIEEFAKNHDSVSVISNQENKGCPASRNVGIKEAKNELIFNLDSDNVLAPHSIKVLKESLIENNADVASFAEYHYFKDINKKITHKWICKSGIFTLADLFSGIFNPAPGGNFLYKKSTWEKVDGYWEYGKGLHEAWGYGFKLLVNGAVFFVAPHTFYFHRYSHDSLFVRENKINNESIKITNKFIEGNLDIFDDYSLKCIKDNPDWYNNLEKVPLKMKNKEKGINGKMVYTSKIKQAVYRVKKLLI